jgi:hypothetical protein
MAIGRARRAGSAAIAAAVRGWWVTALEPFSAPATVAVLAAGAAAMAIGRAGRERATSQVVPLSATVPWIALAGALAAWQLAAYVQHPRSEHPTLSSLINTALDPRPVRALAAGAWMLAAGWLARR